jgi:glucan 1,3-beta-glucosidase
VDEWSLSVNLGNNLESALRQHYDTFIVRTSCFQLRYRSNLIVTYHFQTEEDFAQIAGAGLNWVRISLPFWAIETYEGEPYLEGVAWTYFLKCVVSLYAFSFRNSLLKADAYLNPFIRAITWARKYGLRINLDLHAVPGSQNGWK